MPREIDDLEQLSRASLNGAAPQRPEIDADIGDLSEITGRAMEVLSAANAESPRLFLQGNMPVRLESDDAGRLRPVELNADRLRHELAECARWTKARKTPFGVSAGREDVRPPMDVAKNILASPSIPLPCLKAIVEVPVAARDGRIIHVPGHDAQSSIYFDPYDASVRINFPNMPTESEVSEAKALLDELLTDFNFVADADCAHAVALAVGPFVREMIDGPTPLHNFEAPCPGTGKNLLVETLLSPAVGRNVGLIAEARDEDEWRKRLTARLREARPTLVIDNLSRPLNSGVLAAALTARQWEDRLLGKSETLSVPVRTLWALTANNPVLSMEIARRCVRIRLDAKTDRPWMREGFRHNDLRQWADEHRPNLIQGILTLVRSWICAGRPGPTAKPLGSFEAWSQIVGGIVTHAGFRGFLENSLEFYESSDTDGATWRTFTSLWWEAYRDQPVSVKDLFGIAENLDGLYLGKAANEQGQRSTLGRQLRQRRDQVIGPYRIEMAGSSNNAALWRLRHVGTPVAPSAHTQEEEEEVIHVD